MQTASIDLQKLKKSHWTPQEMANVETIVGFVKKLMNEHDFDYVLEHYANKFYIQHNRNIPDGVEGLVDVIKSFTKRFPDYSYDVKQIIADGDHVLSHSHVTMKKADRGNDKKGLNITDNWKLKDGLIVEHWDSIQAIDSAMRLYALLTGGKVRNANGVF